MTAATIPDVDLEACLNHEAEHPCQVIRGGLLADLLGIGRCERPAEWLMYIIRENCEHAPHTQAVLVSNVCHETIVVEGLRCGACTEWVRITWTERTRSPR